MLPIADTLISSNTTCASRLCDCVRRWRE